MKKNSKEKTTSEFVFKVFRTIKLSFFGGFKENTESRYNTWYKQRRICFLHFSMFIIPFNPCYSRLSYFVPIGLWETNSKTSNLFHSNSLILKEDPFRSWFSRELPWVVNCVVADCVDCPVDCPVKDRNNRQH